MLFVAVFMMSLTLLVFVGFILIGKSELASVEKCQAKTLVIALFCLVAILNEVQHYEDVGNSLKLGSVFKPLDMVPLNESIPIQLVPKFKKEIYIANKYNQYFDGLVNYMESQAQPYVHIKVDYSSAMVLDRNYMKQCFDKLNAKLKTEKEPSTILIWMAYPDKPILNLVEQLFNQNNIRIYIYGTDINKITINPTLYHYGQLLDI